MSEAQAYTPSEGGSTRSLMKRIYEDASPERFVRGVPAQSLYLIVKQQGLFSSADLIELASLEQCRLFLDFDLWVGDTLVEDNLWSWLEFPDEQNNFEILGKFLKFVDLKIIGLLIGRHVTIITDDEGNETPPGPGFSTPDKGHTWIHVHTGEENNDFLLTRLLALIFETDHELFYQLIAIPGVASLSQLEEESFQDRERRLAGTGIPDREMAYSVNKPLQFEQMAAIQEFQESAYQSADRLAVEPFAYETFTTRPLADLLRNLRSPEDFIGELTLITNSAFMHFKVPFHEFQAVTEMISGVKGAINIGLEIAQRQTSAEPHDIYQSYGLQQLYRLGLAQLFELRKAALSVKKAEDELEAPQLTLLDGLRRSFPLVANFFEPDGNFRGEGGQMPGGFKAVEKLEECQGIADYIGAL